MNEQLLVLYFGKREFPLACGFSMSRGWQGNFRCFSRAGSKGTSIVNRPRRSFLCFNKVRKTVLRKGLHPHTEC